VHNTIHNTYISPDEQLATLKSEKGAEILYVTTGQSLFTFPVYTFLSIGVLLNLAFIAFLMHNSKVQIWNTYTHHHKSIIIDKNVFYIALSPNGSQLASLSPSHMKLWDRKSEGCLAHLEFDKPLQVQVQISFSTNTTSLSILKNGVGMQSWCISPNHNIDLTRDSIKNSDGTMSRLISVHHSRARNSDVNKLPIIFVPTTEEWSNWDASVPCQSYHCNTGGKWILDQDGRCVLWIPPDERPRKFWSGFKKVLIQTESGKVYHVNFLQS
jgi:hypothetical protein